MIEQVVVGKGKRPKGFTCQVCKLKLKPGDNAIYFSSKYDAAATHSYCMQRVLDGPSKVHPDEPEAIKLLADDVKTMERFNQLKKTVYANI